jgi:hypothetical protein
MHKRLTCEWFSDEAIAFLVLESSIAKRSIRFFLIQWLGKRENVRSYSSRRWRRNYRRLSRSWTTTSEESCCSLNSLANRSACKVDFVRSGVYCHVYCTAHTEGRATDSDSQAMPRSVTQQKIFQLDVVDGFMVQNTLLTQNVALLSTAFEIQNACGIYSSFYVVCRAFKFGVLRPVVG